MGDGHFMLGSTLMAQGDLAGAIDSYRATLRIDGQNADVYYEVAKALKAQGDFVGAEKGFRHVLQLDPEHEVAQQALEDMGIAVSVAVEKPIKTETVMPVAGPPEIVAPAEAVDQGKIEISSDARSRPVLRILPPGSTEVEHGNQQGMGSMAKPENTALVNSTTTVDATAEVPKVKAKREKKKGKSRSRSKKAKRSRSRS